MSAIAQVIDANTAEAGTERELTDGFHLVIDALKLNGIDTIYGVPGIPITDLGRLAQALTEVGDIGFGQDARHTGNSSNKRLASRYLLRNKFTT